MNRHRLIFVFGRYNHNSVAALAGALDVHPRLADLPLKLVWDGAKLVERVLAQSAGCQRVMIALSFATANAPTMAPKVAALRQALTAQGVEPFFIAGGPHPSGDPEGTLNMGMDLVVRGEGEETLPAVLERWLDGGGFADLPGVAIRQGDELVLTSRARLVEIDDYPPFSVKHERWGFIEISRGCPWACRYCQTSHLMGGRMRHRSVTHIAAAIREAMTVGFSYARFITPDAFAYGSPDGRAINLDAIEDLLRTVSEMVGCSQTYLGSFPSEVRPDMVSAKAVALLRRYTASREVLLGAQSGSERMLQAMGRGHTVTDILRATKIIVEGGLQPTVDFIFGAPGEMVEDREATMALIRQLAELGAVIHSHVFMPLPGTAWAQEPPGQMDPAIVPLLGELGRQGQHYGHWGRQERLARQAAKRRDSHR